MDRAILEVDVGEPVTVTEIVPREEIAARVAELGARISQDYQDSVPVLVGVLSGSIVFHADLVRAISIHCETDFLALTRFGEGGRVRIAMDTETNLEGRDVLIVEDIVDTGLTLQMLRKILEARDCARRADRDASGQGLASDRGSADRLSGIRDRGRVPPRIRPRLGGDVSKPHVAVGGVGSGGVRC